MRSTAEWEAALEGTTPGPWGYYAPRGRDGHYDPIFGATPGDEIALVKRPADWKIMAMAPEAVAEVVRLRRELEALWGMVSRRASMGSLPDIPNYVIAQRINTILEGTHE